MPSLDEALTKYLRLRERFKPQKARGTREEA
jgi:hypothetical protein